MLNRKNDAMEVMVFWNLLFAQNLTEAESYLVNCFSPEKVVRETLDIFSKAGYEKYRISPDIIALLNKYNGNGRVGRAGAGGGGKVKIKYV